jgi:cell division protein FtsL
MTSHVEHTNQMIGQLKFNYQQRIIQLQTKISEQNKEINQLQEQIKLLTLIKEYDC